MTEKTLTTENIKPALDALRGELAPWPVVAKKQDRLNTAQLNAANSGITSSLVAQIIANTAAIRALESAITGTGLRALVVASLPAVGTTGILYIVPVTTYDPDTDADVVNYSNEYIWIPVEGGTASEGHYEQVGQTGIVINNGQLTITVNGTSVGTFTANQSGDTTAAITVPTNADYVDRTTDQTVAGKKTWIGEQSFTLPIVGSITGTAAKAIADEDGTSIKTGYVNVAGNQTVSGQKTWSGNAFYTAGVYHNHTSYESGNTPANNSVSNIYLADKNSVYLGYLRNVVYSSGRTATEIRAKNLFKNGVLDPTGSEITSNLNVEVQPNGTKTLYFDGSIRNNVLPYTTNTYSLGTSSYQWSSVYAQTYFYNGTAWGLDKANTWTALNSYNQSIQITANFNIGAVPSSEVFGGFNFGNGTSSIGNITARVSSSGTTYSRLYVGNKFANGALDPNGTWKYVELQVGLRANGDRFIYTDGLWRNNLTPYNNNSYALGSSSYQWSSVYAQTYYYNGTAWGLDKANVWTGDNTFSGATNCVLTFKIGTSGSYNDIRYSDGNNSVYACLRSKVTDLTLGVKYSSKSVWYDGASVVIRNDGNVQIKSYDGAENWTVNFTPVGIYSTSDKILELGTSTNKWKTLNGVNPGILNHVDTSVTQVDIDTTGWVLDGSAWNTFNTSLYIDGWLYLSYMHCAVDDYISARLGSTNYLKPTLLFKAEKLADNKYYIYATIPVTKKFNIYLEIKTSGTLVAHGLYPSLGNV